MALAFLCMPFSELRTIHYELAGERSISISDIVFLICAIALVTLSLIFHRKELLIDSLKCTMVLSPLLIMMVVYNSDSAISGIQSAVTPLMIAWSCIYMFFSITVLVYYAKEKIEKYLSVYIGVTTIWLFLFYILTRFIKCPPFLYGEATPSFHYPFGSPNQAALFAVLHFILGAAVLITRKRFVALYLVVPVTTLVIFQTGSRSGALLFIISAVVFILFFAMKSILMKSNQRREISHLLFSLICGLIFLFMTATPQNMRGFTLFNYNPAEIITGEVDDYRFKTWKAVAKFLMVEGNGEYEQKILIAEVSRGGMLESPHNAYLDIWLNWGIGSLAAFIIFLTLLFGLSLSMLWKKWRRVDGVMYVAMVLGVAIIMSSIYINPLLHLKFVWIFLGLVMTFWIWSGGRASSQGNTTLKMSEAQ